MIETKKEEIILRENINDNCYEMLVANNTMGFNHFVLYVHHNNKRFHVFDQINSVHPEYSCGTCADYHFNGNNLQEKICSILELDSSTYDKALIYLPESNNAGFKIQTYGFGTNVPEKLDTYEPFVNMAMAANHIKYKNI